MSNEEHLAHYGIRGQKWGVRRYQNPDGTLTAEGRKRARKEYKEDNKEAFKLGKEATILANAKYYSDKSLAKAQARYEKNPTERNKKTLEVEEITNEYIKSSKVMSEDKVNKHYNELVDKYGKDAVKDINRNDRGVNEDIYTVGEMASVLAFDAGFLSMAVVSKMPIIPVFIPPDAKGVGRDRFITTRSAAKKILKKLETNEQAQKNINNVLEKQIKDDDKRREFQRTRHEQMNQQMQQQIHQQMQQQMQQQIHQQMQQELDWQISQLPTNQMYMFP